MTMLKSNLHLHRLASAIVKESGISKKTVEYLLPIAFDVIRRELTESQSRCVIIESFGTFCVKEIPARKYHYVRKSHGIDEWIDRPVKKILKFAPSRNMRREIDAEKFDPSRNSFYHHPDDPQMRSRRDIQRVNKSTPMAKVGNIYYEASYDPADDEEE